MKRLSLPEFVHFKKTFLQQSQKFTKHMYYNINLRSKLVILHVNPMRHAHFLGIVTIDNNIRAPNTSRIYLPFSENVQDP